MRSHPRFLIVSDGKDLCSTCMGFGFNLSNGTLPVNICPQCVGTGKTKEYQSTNKQEKVMKSSREQKEILVSEYRGWIESDVELLNKLLDSHAAEARAEQREECGDAVLEAWENHAYTGKELQESCLNARGESDIHYKINPKVPTENSIQVGCWLCNGTGAIKEMHIHDGQLYNCHESCYQGATQFIRDQIDDYGFGGEE